MYFCIELNNFYQLLIICVYDSMFRRIKNKCIDFFSIKKVLFLEEKKVTLDAVKSYITYRDLL